MSASTRTLLAAAGVVAAAVIGAAVLLSGAGHATGAAQAAPPSTAQVQQGALSAVVSQDGTLTYRARPDGSPYSVINEAEGVYTELPEAGDEVRCGGVLYRVDERPVLLLCGAVPAYRTLGTGDSGPDVRQLHRNLHELGYDRRAGVRIGPFERAFTARTEKALELLERSRGLASNGRLGVSDAVFLPEPLRIARVSGEPGGPARPGAAVLSATSDALDVQVDLEPSQQGQARKGDRAQVTLPGNTVLTGKVVGFGRIAEAPAGAGGAAGPAEATIPTYISLDDSQEARGLDRAPVQVDITTAGVQSALSVPVTALVGKSGGGFAVETVHSGGRRELVGVKVGLFDTGGGRVQVEGDLHAGDRVVVPSL